ncbi:GNAT family N-acetyltransferase [Streptomyces sp. DSM 42041]|uniref:GNAT family N-acetyltransferase n=1 Tax=Streptomyces hazeniae TaxID=3075538 RepID=A0ABU2NYP1_9ACTN|nr:GNAT family N-acetyltransferase [Streptomyces sp. DSM 42041]MDT0382110.1 GNAT family N-acetyltransferase [Streptomyces sp. DSM 42041]
MNVISLGFRTDLMMLEMSGSVVVDRSTHQVVRTPTNPGFWWGNYVLVASPLRDGDADHWTHEFGEYFPEATHFSLGVDGVDGEAGDAAELARLGVTVEVNAVLTAEEMPAPDRTPPGVDLRPLHGDDDWAQAARVHASCDDGDPSDPAHRAFTENRQADLRRLCEDGYGAWFGAFVDGRMAAGAGIFTDGSGLARYQNVETHPDHRRHGLATAVVQHAGHWALTELRANTLVIVADPDYHAVDLYRRLGFTETERQVQLQRGT